MTLDKVGVALSFGCLVHCIVFPIVIPLLPFVGLVHEHGGEFHLIMIGLVVIVGIPAISIGFKKHADPRPLVGFALSLILLLIAGIAETFAYGSHDTITMLTILGGLGIATSHIQNHRASCSCEHHRKEKCHSQV